MSEFEQALLRSANTGRDQEYSPVELDVVNLMIDQNLETSFATLADITSAANRKADWEWAFRQRQKILEDGIEWDLPSLDELPARTLHTRRNSSHVVLNIAQAQQGIDWIFRVQPAKKKYENNVYHLNMRNSLVDQSGEPVVLNQLAIDPQGCSISVNFHFPGYTPLELTVMNEARLPSGEYLFMPKTDPRKQDKYAYAGYRWAVMASTDKRNIQHLSVSPENQKDEILYGYVPNKADHHINIEKVPGGVAITCTIADQEPITLVLPDTLGLEITQLFAKEVLLIDSLFKKHMQDPHRSVTVEDTKKLFG